MRKLGSGSAGKDPFAKDTTPCDAIEQCGRKHYVVDLVTCRARSKRSWKPAVIKLRMFENIFQVSIVDQRLQRITVGGIVEVSQHRYKVHPLRFSEIVDFFYAVRLNRATCIRLGR